jgi:hypothetical protein
MWTDPVDPRATEDLPEVPPECAQLAAENPHWRLWGDQDSETKRYYAYHARLITDPESPQWEVAGGSLYHITRLVGHFNSALSPWRLGRGTRPVRS